MRMTWVMGLECWVVAWRGCLVRLLLLPLPIMVHRWQSRSRIVKGLLEAKQELEGYKW